MANNPFMRDKTILKESTYLDSLKETTEVNPTAKLVIEKKLAALKESEGQKTEEDKAVDKDD